MNAPHPNLETDWQGVAMFLAGVITEEKPDYAPLIAQVIADFTTKPKAKDGQKGSEAA